MYSDSRAQSAQSAAPRSALLLNSVCPYSVFCFYHVAAKLHSSRKSSSLGTGRRVADFHACFSCWASCASRPGSPRLSGLAATILVAVFLYGMPLGKVVGATTYGAAFGLFPIGWIVIWAVFLYRLTLDTGKFEAIKHSIGSLTSDRRLQALLIAFAFGAFVEGAAGFGTPVAVASAMLAGLGFSPFYAAAICLLANTAPVAFGSIAIPIVTLAGITGLPLDRLSAGVGRICAPVSLIVPAYLVLVMGGWKALRPVLPAAIALRRFVRRHAVPHLELRGTATHGSASLRSPRSSRWCCCSWSGNRRTRLREQPSPTR